MANFYGKLLPLIVLIVLPCFAAILYIIWQYSNNAASSLIIVVPLLAITYGIYPARFTIEEHFKKRGYEGAIIEFETTKRIFFIITSLLIIFIALSFYYQYYISRPEISDLEIVTGYIIGGFGAIFVFAAVGAGLRILTRIAKREFRFYFAKGYCMMISKKADEFEKVKYLFLALDSYNKYLRRRLKFEIKDIKKIYSKFLCVATEEKDQAIRSICESLEGDRLELARYLSSTYKVSEAELFVSESITQRLKIVGTFLAATLPIIISIIQIFQSIYGKGK